MAVFGERRAGGYIDTHLDDLDLTLTDLKLAKVGEPVPAFSLTLLDGTTLTPEALKGKTYVLDF